MPRRSFANTISAKSPSRVDHLREPVVADLAVTSLAMYPAQTAIYGDLSGKAMQTLRQSMEADGQRDPIVVLPPDNAAGLPGFTILDGHQRVAVAEALGWPTIRAVVRWDLVAASIEEVHRLFLRMNFVRRQLSPMQQALVIVAMREAMTDRRRKYFNADDWRAVRDQIAEQLGISGRNAMRYVRVLNTPLAIQIAVRDGRLTCLSLAERIETLPQEQQEEIAAQIVSIDDPAKAKALVESYLPKPRTKKTLKADFEKLVKALSEAQESFGDRISDITHASWREYIARLEPGLQMLERLVAQLRSIDPDADPLRDMADTMSEAKARNTGPGDQSTMNQFSETK